MEKIKEEKAIEQMLRDIDDNLDEDKLSGDSEPDEETAQREISEKVDGLLVYQTSLPLFRTKYRKLIKALKKVKSTIRDKAFKDLI